jgi:hypothetical protein
MVQVSAEALSIDDSLAVFEAIKVGARRSVVAAVGFFRSNAFAVILDDAGSFADRCGRVDADSVNG